MKKYLLISLFFLFFLLELIFTTVPLVFIFLINSIIFFKKEWVFVLAFFLGILMDFFQMRQLGATAIFFISVLYLITLYERKFESTSMYFILITSFFASLLYLLIFYSFSILESLVAMLISFGIFSAFEKFSNKKVAFHFRRING